MYMYSFLLRQNLPQNGNQLLFWRASKIIIYPMLQNPHNCSNNKEECCCDQPHRYSEWPKERPGTGV